MWKRDQGRGKRACGVNLAIMKVYTISFSGAKNGNRELASCEVVQSSFSSQKND